MRVFFLIAVLVLAPAVCRRHCVAEDGKAAYVVEVDAGDHDRQATPVVVELPAAVNDVDHLGLQSPDGGSLLPLQRLPGESSRAVFILTEPLAAGETRSYRLVTSAGPRAAPAGAPPVRCVPTATAIRIDLGGHPVLQYNTAVVEPPAGIDPLFRRSGHIHPVFTPAGRIVTEEFPADHAHQHGIFNAWVNTTFEGRPVDFWNQAARSGRVEHVGIDTSQDGNVFAQFIAELRHSALNGPDGVQPVLQEHMLVRAWNVPDGHLFDIESREVDVADAPLIINEYHYGGMAFRGAAGWLGQPEHDFLTSEGGTRADGNHTRPVWVAAHGLVQGQPCTIVVFGHPRNFRHPQPVRLHPEKPYFVFTPPVLGEFSIEPGSEYVSRYRYLVHDGTLDPDWYDRVWCDIADPPTVRVAAANTNPPSERSR